MKHGAFTAAIALCTAALFFWMFPKTFLPVLILLLVLVAISTALFCLFRKWWLRDILFFVSCLAVSALLLWFPVSDYYETAEHYDGKTFTHTVTLTEDPVLSDAGFYRYTARPNNSFRQKFVFFSTYHYGYAGDSVRAEFFYSKPEEPYAFSNMADGVALSASLNTPYDEVEVFEGTFSFYKASGTVRRYVYKTFLRYVGGSEAGFMHAVLTGDKSSLSTADAEHLQATGMTHIVAVSGLHVSVFVSFVLFFLKKIPKIRLRLILSFLTLVLILLFSGFTPSVCRAVIMNGVIFGGQWFSRGTDKLNRLGLSAIVILLAAPYAAWSLSFQLSFAAALGILLFASPFTQTLIQCLFEFCHVICGKVLQSAISLFAVSVSAFVFTLPLLWLRLDSYSVWSLFLSPIILPVLEVCFFAALILLLFGLIPFLSPFSLILGYLIQFGVKFMSYLTGFASSLMNAVESIPLSLKLVIMGVALLLAALLFFAPETKTGSKKKKKKAKSIRRSFALLLLVIALLTAYQAASSLSGTIAAGDVTPDEGVFQTAFLDVGQGNCFVSIYGDEAYIVDCGGTKKPGIAASDYLTAAGIDKVKFVLISHLHDDHANGLKDLCEEKEIEEFIIPYTEGDAGLYAEITLLAEQEEAKLTVLEEDSERTLGKSKLRLLTKHLDPTSDDQNENSIVGYAEFGNLRMLFTGDITAKAERRLVKAYGNALDCDVLSSPHHGSKYSSCEKFLDACTPVTCVISVGAGNSYGHPNADIITRYEEYGAKVYRTDTLSTVTIRSDGTRLEVLTAHES